MKSPLASLRPALVACLLAAALAGGCVGDNGSSGGIGGSDNPGPSPSQLGGNVQVLLTDSVAADLSSVYLTVEAVQIHRTGDPADKWVTIVPNDKVNTPVTVNVLALRNGAKANLGVATVGSGGFDAMRIRFGDTPQGSGHPAGNYIYHDAKRWEPLLFPSGLQQPVALRQDLRISQDVATRLLIHFDLEGSVLQTVSGDWVVQPQMTCGELPDLASIRGRAFEETEEGLAPLSGVLVYAQSEDNSRPEGLRIVQTTITSAPEDGTPGTYLLEGLEPGQAYNIVFIKNGYEVRAIRVNAPGVDVYSGHDVTLYPAVYHRLDGLVQLEPFQPGASIDIRLVRNVPPDNLRVIVLHQHPSPRQPGNEGPVRYEFEVPAARYDFYWSAQGYDWVRDTFDITGNGPLPFVVLEGQ